jgi:hypothetical protein
VHDGEALGDGDGDGRCSHGFFRRLVSGLGLVLGFSQLCVCVCVCVSLSLSLSIFCRNGHLNQHYHQVQAKYKHPIKLWSSWWSGLCVWNRTQVCLSSFSPFPNYPNFFSSELSGVLDFYTEHASHHHHGSKVFLLPEFGPGVRSFWVLRYRVHGVHGS